MSFIGASVTVAEACADGPSFGASGCSSSDMTMGWSRTGRSEGGRFVIVWLRDVLVGLVFEPAVEVWSGGSVKMGVYRRRS